MKCCKTGNKTILSLEIDIYSQVGAQNLKVLKVHLLHQPMKMSKSINILKDL